MLSCWQKWWWEIFSAWILQQFLQNVFKIFMIAFMIIFKKIKTFWSCKCWSLGHAFIRQQVIVWQALMTSYLIVNTAVTPKYILQNRGELDLMVLISTLIWLYNPDFCKESHFNPNESFSLKYTTDVSGNYAILGRLKLEKNIMNCLYAEYYRFVRFTRRYAHSRRLLGNSLTSWLPTLISPIS